MITRRDLLTVSAAGVAFSAAGLVPRAVAQPLAKTAHILTGFTPGLQDALARLIAGQMTDYAESIVVETRPGAAGRVAVEAVKTADADGTVMLFAPLGFMMLFPHVYKTLRYEPRDFTPVSTVASTPTLLTVGPKVPGDVRTLADFVTWCRANPKQATYGTAGVGTALHFLGAMLARTAAFDFLHVPYQGPFSL
ncbi:tripartite tricarboxylate transporter substrate-binding protein [Bradyrhizobium sp. Leo170]|uniref:Bug family tripartite tricarboxylate transporter substrate binding protein n=1 Tax=Bradyrhizobium sp. Leo170 TaxID=1571199 RepID=UPI001FE1544D|nr:tripartite tricarboxylate transporter substrate-binding protein [Bradyrhizobium sp. Leo170]